MTPPVMLFAAGLGTRMGPLVADRPKPLIDVGGTTLLDHALDLVAEAGLRRPVVNLHYKADMIRDHLKGRDVVFSDETGELLETGGGLRHALPLLTGNPVVTLNTDAAWRGPNPIRHLLGGWSDGMEALLLLVPTAQALGHKGQGDFSPDPQGRLSRGRGAVYTGLQMIRTETLIEIPERRFSMNLLWDRMAARGGLYGTVWPGDWCDVGQPDSLPLAEQLLDV